MKDTTPDHTTVMPTPHSCDDDLRAHAGVAPGAGDVVVDARAAESRVVEHARQDGAEDAADAVHAEHVERVVVAERALQLRDREQADHAGQQADDDRAHRTDPAAGRGDRDETGDGAGSCTEHGRRAAEDPFTEGPGADRSGRGEEGVDEDLSGERIRLRGSNRR